MPGRKGSCQAGKSDDSALEQNHVRLITNRIILDQFRAYGMDNTENALHLDCDSQH